MIMAQSYELFPTWLFVNVSNTLFGVAQQRLQGYSDTF